MTLEEKKNKLRKYAIAIDRLARKCREADRWDSMAEGTGGIVQAGRRRGEPDVIKETAIAVRQECEQLASEANDLRRELVTALDQVADDERRELLERKYLEGKSNASSRQSTVCASVPCAGGWAPRFETSIDSAGISWGRCPQMSGNVRVCPHLST